MKTCSVCVKKHYAKGYCEAHYKSYRENNNLCAKMCSIDGCKRPHYGWDMCRRHYKAEYKRRNRNILRHTVEYKLEKNLRNRHNQALAKAVSKSHPIKHLGCTIEQLKQHIESMFYDNPTTGKKMSWDDRGLGLNKWQIDHIVPFSSIDINDEEQQLKICHYTNLQPLWHEEHVEKSSKERWDES